MAAPDANFINSLAEVDPPSLPPAQAGRLMEAGSLLSYGEFFLTGIILFFGLVALGIFYLMFRRQTDTAMLMRIYVIIILVFGTLLVVSSAYSTEQIAPVVGFFGTIAGYLLGRGDRSSTNIDEGRGP